MKENITIEMHLFKKINNFYLSILDYYLFKRYEKYKLKFPQNYFNTALIIGSGPSLTSFNFDKIDIKKFEIYVVNGFSKTDLYQQLKPKNYCILDPIYFDLNDNRVLQGEVDVIETWQNIFSKTNWDIIIYVSLLDIQKIEFIKSKFPINYHITFVNLFPVRFSSINRFNYYSKGIGFVGGNTVVQLAVNISLLKRTRNTYLIGVDHNWFENFTYDHDSNDIFLLNKHFYGEKRIYYPSGELNSLYDLSGEFNSLHNSFEQFKELHFLAKYLNLKLFRSTKSFLHFLPFSKID